ncbi:MAG TPA: aquaporin [Candidatus Saccharimonadales bacterium]|nr:aquaporin [Candidatus Saccharimonadales bacterium]
MITRRKIAMIAAEFLGTGLLTLIILAVGRSQLGAPYFIGIAAGLTLVMATLVLGRVSGAHLNPAITIGLWSVRRIKAVPAIVYIAAQIIGAGVAYFLYSYLVGQTLENTTAGFEGKVLVAEAVGAFVFSLGWAAVVYQRLEGGRAATVLGVSLMLGMLVASVGMGLYVNPAVALGAHSWVWGTYALGPVLGAIIGFNLYGLLFAPEKELTDAAEASARRKTIK